MVRFETVAGRLPVRDAFASSSRVKHCPDEVDNIPTMRSAESTKKLLDSTNSLGERCNDTRSRARTIGMEDHCSTVASTINTLILHRNVVHETGCGEAIWQCADQSIVVQVQISVVNQPNTKPSARSLDTLNRHARTVHSNGKTTDRTAPSVLAFPKPENELNDKST